MVQLGQTLHRVRNTLQRPPAGVRVTVSPELERALPGAGRAAAASAPCWALGSVLSREGAVALQLRASQVESELVLTPARE